MPASYTHSLDVRFRDCDPLGHVNNAVYLTYLEQARFNHWRSAWGFGTKDLPPEMPGVILARAEIDYKLPAQYGDTLEVRMRVSNIGRTSFSYDYDIVDAAGRIVATAKTVQVMYDYAKSMPVPIPARIRELLEGR
jgi:acyl-CoA thioester hydrolase